MALIGNELVTVQPISPTGAPSGVTELTTTQAIANLGGGGGGGGIVTHQREISSGSSDSADLNDGLILWNSATTSPKTQTIPTSSGNLQTIMVMDFYGNSSTYPITIAPVSGSINNIYSSVDIATSGDSLTLIDSALGWILQ